MKNPIRIFPKDQIEIESHNCEIKTVAEVDQLFVKTTDGVYYSIAQVDLHSNSIWRRINNTTLEVNCDGIVRDKERFITVPTRRLKNCEMAGKSNVTEAVAKNFRVRGKNRSFRIINPNKPFIAENIQWYNPL